MPPNCLWTTVFNGVDSKSQDLTRQVIVMEERRGKRASQEQVPGPEYQAMMKAPVIAHEIRDPWKPKPGTQEASGRHTIQPAVQGYAGNVPRVRTEHIGIGISEQQAQFQSKFGTEGYAKMRSTAPGGGASALGTAPFPMPGTRGSTRVGLYDSLRQAEQISSMRS
tara:strand:- start:203 stop:700 length:498 start_codon:yes stop_codon:yes gene_type:complete|mmetsp:Transcript_6319/g.15215  ORF Transcript_6319/g.15215 Transcript_6319/m.15215 type:complete len:166 (-) Transcript_6319:278-775(-)